jgi:hypothetical protein
MQLRKSKESNNSTKEVIHRCDLKGIPCVGFCNSTEAWRCANMKKGKNDN